MGVPKIISAEQLAAHKARRNKASGPIALIYILYFCALAIVVTVLPFQIPTRSVPVWLQPLWWPLPLIFVFGFPGLLLLLGLLRLIPWVRKYTPVDEAITRYEAAQGQYVLYGERSDLEALLSSHESVEACREVLGELPEFQEFAERVEKSYQRAFKAGSRETGT